MQAMMKKAGKALGWVAMAALLAPVGSLADIRWRTTHGAAENGVCKLMYSSVRVKVTPAYLDVEEEAEVAAVGGLWSSGDPNSLEIFGEFDLVPGSTMVGMLLWNGDIMLKARLKGRVLAKEEFDKVVDRDKNPPPILRDPALIEALGGDRYRIQIYPVASGKSRRIRLRYHIPVQMAPSGAMLRLRTVFPPQIADNPGRIQVKWERGAGEEGYVLYTNGRVQALALPTNSLIGSGDDIYITQSAPPTALSAMTSFGEGAYKGHYAALHYLVPDKILNYPSLSSTPNYSVVAVLKNGGERYALDVNCNADNGLRCDPLEFHGKSASGWNPEVEWKLYNSTGRELVSVTTSPKEFSRPGDSTLVALWAGSALPFAEVRERYLGVKYGFVDVSVSLLALEKDLLPAVLVPVYAASGVPRLTPADIFPPDTNDVFIPVPIGPRDPNDPRTVGTLRKLDKLSAGPMARLVSRGFPVLSLDLARLAAPVNGKVRVTLIGLDGREVFSMDVTVSADGGPALLPLPALKDGFYFLRVEGLGVRWSEKILLRR